jgi:nitric oxide reductase large subunit
LAITTAVIELIFSILENSLLCVEGKITQSELVEEVATASAKAGIAGGVITGILLTLCMIFSAIAALLGVAAMRLTVTGIGFMGIRAWEIFCRADRLFGITQQTQKFLGMTEPLTVDC